MNSYQSIVAKVSLPRGMRAVRCLNTYALIFSDFKSVYSVDITVKFLKLKILYQIFKRTCMCFVLAEHSTFTTNALAGQML